MHVASLHRFPVEGETPSVDTRPAPRQLPGVGASA